MSRRAATLGIVLGIGALTGAVLLATRAEASPEDTEGLWLTGGGKPIIPTADDILAAKTAQELDTYYTYIGLLILTMVIVNETYQQLYQAYVTRFYELIGENQ